MDKSIRSKEQSEWIERRFRQRQDRESASSRLDVGGLQAWNDLAIELECVTEAMSHRLPQTFQYVQNGKATTAAIQKVRPPSNSTPGLEFTTVVSVKREGNKITSRSDASKALEVSLHLKPGTQGVVMMVNDQEIAAKDVARLIADPIFFPEMPRDPELIKFLVEEKKAS